MTSRTRGIAAVGVMVASVVAAGARGGSTAGQTSNTSRAGAPRFEVDTSWQWPPALPSNWVVGVVSGVAVDRRDHVWVLHRFRQVPADQKDRAAPPVLEFDADRRFVQAWGGPGEGYDWPDTEHGLFVDHQRWTGSTSTRSSSIRTVLSGPSRRARWRSRRTPRSSSFM